MDHIATNFLQPIVTESLFGDTITVALYGKPKNWAEKFRQGSFEDIARLANYWGAHEVQMPSVREFNARVIGAYDFPEEIMVENVKICSGILADGAVLPIGSGRTILSADCPTVILRSAEGKVIVAHAGRDCLFDRKRIQTGRRSDGRRHESVIDAALAELKAAPHTIHARIVCGAQICEHRPDHPIYGDFNKKLVTEVVERFGPSCIRGTGGELRLYVLIAKQLFSHAVPLSNITWDDIDSRTDPRFWSQGRGENERNCVFVFHHAPRSSR